MSDAKPFTPEFQAAAPNATLEERVAQLEREMNRSWRVIAQLHTYQKRFHEAITTLGHGLVAACEYARTKIVADIQRQADSLKNNNS